MTNNENKALFIGNGVNRAFGNSISWDELLQKIIKDIRKEEVIREIDKPFTLLAEEIYLRAKLYRDISIAEIKNSIEEIFKSNLTLNNEGQDFLNNLISCNNYNNIITTNYDNNIEKSLNLNCEQKSAWNRLESKNRFTWINIWHPHGSIDHYKSILLGYQEYIEYVSLIEETIENNSNETWVKIFLDTKNHIDIIGYGYDFSEIHMWRLLAYRAEKMKRISNITYYEVYRGSLSKNIKTKHSMLEAFGVKVIKIRASDFKEGYKKLLLRTKVNLRATTSKQNR